DILIIDLGFEGFHLHIRTDAFLNIREDLAVARSMSQFCSRKIRRLHRQVRSDGAIALPAVTMASLTVGLIDLLAGFDRLGGGLYRIFYSFCVSRLSLR